MANQIIVANSKVQFNPSGTTYAGLNPTSSGVVTLNPEVPAAVMADVANIHNQALPITWDIMEGLLDAGKDPLASYLPNFSHKEAGPPRVAPVSAGSTVAAGAGLSKVINLAAQSFSGNKTAVRKGSFIYVGSVECFVDTVTPGTPTSITVFPYDATKTIPATTAGDVMGYVSNSAPIGATPNMATPEIDYYEFPNFIQIFSTPLKNTDSFGQTQQEQYQLQWSNYAISNGSYAGKWLNSLNIPTDQDSMQLFSTAAANIAYQNHVIDEYNAYLMGVPTANPLIITALGQQPMYTVNGLLPQIAQYGGISTYVGATGMTVGMFVSIANEARYYGYIANEYLLFLPTNVRIDFQNFIRAYMNIYNEIAVDSSEFAINKAQFLNTTFTGIQIDGQNFRMHKKFDISQLSYLSATQWQNKGFYIPLIEGQMGGRKTRVIEKVVRTNGTGDFNANTSFPQAAKSGYLDDRVTFDSVGSVFGGNQMTTTLQDISQTVCRSASGVLIRHPYTMGMITRT